MRSQKGDHLTPARALLATALCCQTLLAQGPPSFRAGVDVVYIDATTIDREGRAVIGLTRDDFEIFEDGVKQEISVFSDKPSPISVGVLIDRSLSMKGERIAAASRAAEAVGKALSLSDQWSLFAFNTNFKQLTPWRQFDPRALVALSTLEASGGTSLFEAVVRTVPNMREAKHRKRALLVITDGLDDARRGVSTPDYSKHAVDTLRSGEVLVYGLGMDWPVERGRDPGLDVAALRMLAEPTGGAVAVARTDADLLLAAKRLTDELRQQYTLGFVPQKAFDGNYRRIQVSVKREGVRVRARSGYLATARK